MDNGKIVSIAESDKELYKNKVKVFLAEPTQGLVNYIAHDNRLDLYMHISRLEAHSDYKFFTGNVGRLFISYARELICERALEGGMDYILWIDDDMIVPFNLFERLVKHNVDIVSPLTFQRVPPYNPVMWRDTIKDNSLAFEQITEYEPNCLLEIPQVGFGVVLMKTEVLRKLPQPWFMGNVGVGEDIFFTYKAKQEGIKSYVDTSFCVGHLSTSPIITEEEFLQYRDNKYIKVGGKTVLDFGVKGNAELSRTAG